MCIKTGFNVPLIQQVMSIVRRIASPVVKRLQIAMSCGLTPQKIVLTLCIGSALGIMPLLWGTTLICVLFAYLFKLNQVALQSVNYLLYPVQLVLLVPFFKLGSRLFPWGPPVPPHLLAAIISNPQSSCNILGWITLKSLMAWLVIVIPATLLAYGILWAVVTRKMSKTTEL
jgi:Uncharacterized protein conserved in bacteria (DUF2062)